MKLFKRLTEKHRANQIAAEANETARAAAEAEHRVALDRLAEATRQAETLSAMDTRNHYSESLTHAFRGRTA